MNYELKVAIATSDDQNFVVYEKLTDQIIKQFRTRDEAKKFLRFLNMGGAFDGFTPQFILKKFVIPNDFPNNLYK